MSITYERKVQVIPPKININTTKKQEVKRIHVAAYCRVSTSQEEQENSYESQVAYYTKLITDTPEWNLVAIYADVYNQRLIPFDTKKAVQTLKITAFEGKNANRKPLFLFCEVMMPDCWVHQCTQQIRGGCICTQAK